jgi:uncharacterized iron-regulated membrane protein
MHSRTLRRWSWVHTWTSLIATAFLFVLCLTGLPLIFHDEIDDFFYPVTAPASRSETLPRANLDAVADVALSKHPGETVQFLIWDRDDPDVVRVAIGKTIAASPAKNLVLRIDEHTGQFLDEPDITARVTNILLRLHSELFVGMPGKLFLGFIGLMFILAAVSGVVLYAPSMRKLDFGTVRRGRTKRIYWLDLHNLLGIVTLLWALVVGATGVVNTLADIVQASWQRDQLAAIHALDKVSASVTKAVPVQVAVETAERAFPDMKPLLVAYPGTAFTSKTDYAVLLKGDSVLTSRLTQAALVDAATGQLAGVSASPWYVSALLLSQPLHFGDYGGLPLKVIWAVLDLFVVFILATGLWLWLQKIAGSRR